MSKQDMQQIAKLLATLYASEEEETPLVFAFDKDEIFILGSGEIVEVKVRRIHKLPAFRPLMIEAVEPMPI